MRRPRFLPLALPLPRPLILGALVMLLSVACSGAGDPAAIDRGTTSTPSSGPVPAVVEPAVEPAVDPVGTTKDATLVTPDGLTRTYRLYVPSSVAAGTGGPAVPLLVALHGGGGSGRQFEATSGFDGLAEANGFVVVYPDGSGTGVNGDAVRTWNGGACCGAAVRDDVDDVSFIRTVIDTVRAEYPIDPARVVAAGHSNGGILAYRLACELSGEIAAIGVQSSSIGVDGCAPARPVSLIHVHGTADQNVPIAGGEGADAASGVAFRPVIDGPRTLAQVDGCAGDPAASTSDSNPDVETQRWPGCPTGIDVELELVTGAGHPWMGHSAPRAGVDSYADLDSSAVIWAFLASHPRP